MDSPPCQAYIVPSAPMDYLFHPVRLGWSVWDDNCVDWAFVPLRGCSSELESVWLSCVE